MEWGPLSLVSTTEKLLERKSSGSVYKAENIQRSGFDSWRYQIFLQVVGMERGPHSLVSTTEELLSSSSLESNNMAIGICHTDHVALSIRKLGTNFGNKRRLLS
jgi:hypothetical protein